jgi:RNA polymerase sigma-70 factor (ECF subfamily)
MDEREWRAERFEAHRTHPRTVAYRMLGSFSEAEGAVQEAWLRLSRSDAREIENLGGRLTTVVGRVSPNIAGARTQPLGLRLGWRGDEPC